jgi:hypothetical protein
MTVLGVVFSLSCFLVYSASRRSAFAMPCNFVSFSTSNRILSLKVTSLQEAGGNVLSSDKVLARALSLNLLHLDFYFAVKHLNVI